MAKIRTEIGKNHAGSGIDKPAHGLVSGLVQKVKDGVGAIKPAVLTTPIAETARQEGAQGRVGKTPDDKIDNGQIDASDVNMKPKM